MKVKHYLLILFGFLALSFVLYSKSLPGEFLYDDHYFSDRRDIHYLSYLPKLWFEPFFPNNPITGTYRPLAIAAFSLNFILFGNSPLSFHIINVILNALVCFFVFILTQKLFKDRTLSLLTSLIYCVMPIHTEAVAFIKSRDELLSGLFIFASWFLFIKAVYEKNKHETLLLWLSALLFILSVFSKETGFFYPGAFLFVYIVQKKPELSKLIKIGLIYVLASIPYLYLRYKVLGIYSFGLADVSYAANFLFYSTFWTRIFTAFKILFIYLSNILIPVNLSASYHLNHLTPVTNPFNSLQASLGLVILVTFFVSLFLKKFRESVFGIGIVVFFILYFAYSKFVFVGGDIVGERWMYVPSFGIALSLAAGFVWLNKHKRYFAVLLSIAIVGWYSYITFERNDIWLSGVNLFQSMIRDAPESVRGHTLLAAKYINSGKYYEALQEVEKGKKILPDDPYLINLEAALAVKDGNLKLAETLYLKSLKFEPKLTQTSAELGSLYFATKNYDRAAAIFHNTIFGSIKPRLVDVIGYSSSLAKLGHYQESIDIIFQKAPLYLDDPRLRFILTVNYYKLGKVDESKKYMDWDTKTTVEEKFKIIENF